MKKFFITLIILLCAVQSIVAQDFASDLEIYMKSPLGSSLLVAVEDNPDDISKLISHGCGGKSLNEIRFAGWTRDNLFDNDYLRAFRRYMDKWLHGKEIDKKEVAPSTLEPYRERLSGKFYVLGVSDFLFGGLLYLLFPIDDPCLILRVWIYSTVDENCNVNEYLVQYFEVMDVEEHIIEQGLTKDQLREYFLQNVTVGVRKLWYFYMVICFSILPDLCNETAKIH